MNGPMFHYGAYKKCPTCGKQFFVPLLDDWAYRRYGKGAVHDRIYICSWSCLRKWDEDHPNRRGRPRKKHKEEFEA